MPNIKFTPDLISAAIDGYEAQKVKIDEKIAELRSMLGGRSSTTAEPSAEAPTQVKERKKRRLSAAGRKAIAEAAKKRWAAFNAEKKKAS
jgi:hypothetical protein